MKRWVRRYIRLLCAGVCIAVLASCRTIVPEPTMPVSASDAPVPKYSLHNIGPQRVNASRAILLSDVNQDGNLDLLVGGRAPHHQSFRIEWGDGRGRWSLEGGPVTGMQPRAFAVSDMDASGINEIVIGGEGDTKGLQIWALDTKTHRWTLQSTAAEDGVYNAVRFADVNEDGWPDLVALRMDSEQDGGIDIYLNEGTRHWHHKRGGLGHWSHEVGPMVEGRFTGLAVADVNGDGHADIIASRRAGIGATRFHDEWREVGGVQIWYGDGQGRWELEDLPADGDAESVTVTDLNGDGKMDIVSGLYLHGITAWLRQDGDWSREKVVDKGTWASVRVGDLNDDGQRELVAASTDGRGIGVWRYRHGFSRLHGLVPDYGVYSQVDLGDVLNSGKMDIAALRADGAVEIWSSGRAAKEPLRHFTGAETGQPLKTLFDTASATLTKRAEGQLEDWFKQLPDGGRGLKFRVEGHADIRPVRSETFPDNRALSRARAESVAAWLEQQGVPSQQLQVAALGVEKPLPPGMAPDALRQNRRVIVRAYSVRQVRLPDVAAGQPKRDLFHVNQNDVFKTIDGVSEYRVGPGDELSLTLWEGGKPNEYKVTVQVDGTVSIPYFDALQVNGLTPTEIDHYMTKKLTKFVRRPRVDVQVLQARSKTASVFGEVKNLARQPTGPGTYFLDGKETLAQFLSRVGGPTQQADLTKVQIVRHGGKVVLNLERAIEENDWTENAIIDAGDTIFVPSLSQSKHRVYVLGAVKKPGIVDYTGEIRFIDAVSKSAGFTDSAYLKDIRIIRQDRDRPLIVPVAFNRFMERGDLTQNPELRDKDVIIVPDEPIENWNKMLAKLMPTLNTVFRGSYTINEVYRVRDLLRGTINGSGATIAVP